ncbi:UPF0640 protein [Habropoda laboriosa]|uniref:UPF0640 protein n=1 Tax=Habropoda laboriosa TaxID=597456 RepID=A0A0L7QYL4_9HYME|nr:UPF0640 protein [Habropoda laboriosa]
MFDLKKKIRRFVQIMPGQFLGEYRFLPIFLLGGALIEFTMINWHVGEVNFYKTYKKRRIEEVVERRLQEMETET